MRQVFLIVATHWNVPGVRQLATTSRMTADRQATAFVNELVADWASGEHHRDAMAPPPVSGTDWEPTLRALQLARLVDYEGGEGEANDSLAIAAERHFRDAPPLIGEGFPFALQEAIGEFVAEDDSDPDGIGFPMVWIEEVAEAMA